ncbi:ComF family protein [Providencia heimbachae]|uniref:ComF family protein n=1 Tax=Providencia heimbachae TaxID=333962 RepID=UPI0008398205|nr:ComF family protein [Providencia heimbachae]NIH22128.1 ComF family protein [Providencia heimbachae]
MQVAIKQITGNWDLGFAMDKHMIRSTYMGDNEYGRPQFNNERTEVGEAVYQLKYKQDYHQIAPLAQCLYDNAIPFFENIQLVIPMAASNERAIQPVTAIARLLAEEINVPCFEELLFKQPGGTSLKDLKTKAEKEEAVAGAFYIRDQIREAGPFNALIIDDLFHTGASMEAACKELRRYNKINKIYVAALTWK